jgi:alpha-tubulin suppressor-like RCC1 family protein
VAIAPPDLVEIATGGAHVVALDANGTAWVWGSRFGCSPRAVLTDVTAIAAGDTDLCLFVRSDGTAWGLGYNLHGQLGNGTTISNYTTPRLVSGLSDVVQVAAGERHSLFVTGDGSLFAAGWNRYCQLGLEDEPTPTEPQVGVAILSPVQVQLSDVVLVAGGDLHTVAVTGDGKVWGWGLNNVGQLHSGTLSVLPGTVCAPMEIEVD